MAAEKFKKRLFFRQSGSDAGLETCFIAGAKNTCLESVVKYDGNTRVWYKLIINNGLIKLCNEHKTRV